MSNKEKTALVPSLRFPKFRDSGNWIECTFGGLATFFNGRAYKQDELLESGKYRVLRVGNFFSNNEWYYSDLELEDNKYCEYGDLLYAWSATFGPKIWKGEKVIYHYHIWKVVNNEDVNTQFLFFLLDYETEKMKVQSANGLGLLHITKGTIENWKCYRPCFEEQQKIADCLSSLDDLITAEDKKLSALRAHKKGLMQKLFPAKGKSLPEWRFPEFRDFGEWEEINFGDLCEFTRGPFGGALKKEIFVSDGYAVYEQSHAIYGNFDSFRYFITEEKFNELSRFSLQEDDIIMSCSGTMGRFAIIPKGSKKGVINQALLKLTVKNGVDVKFVKMTLELDVNQKNLLSQSAGGAIKNVVSVSQMKEIKILIPHFTEQQKIADCLSSLENLITSQAEKIEALKTHKKGLMQGLFPSIEEVGK